MIKNKFEVLAQEFLLNISQQDGVFSDTFIYEPINIEEEKLGNLYMVGHILIDKEEQEKNLYIINYLSSIIKKEYYSNTRRTVSQSMEASIKIANEFLKENVERGDLNPSNLCFGIFLLSPDCSLHFAQIGSVKTLLIRNKEIFDLSEKLTAVETSGFPNKFFAKIAKGKLENSDFIIISTGSLSKNVSDKIQNGLNPNLFFDKIQRKSIFSSEDFQQVNGVMLMLKIREHLREEKRLENDERQKLLINFRSPSYLEKLKAAIPNLTQKLILNMKKCLIVSGKIAISFGTHRGKYLLSQIKKYSGKFISIIPSKFAGAKFTAKTFPFRQYLERWITELKKSKPRKIFIENPLKIESRLPTLRKIFVGPIIFLILLLLLSGIILYQRQTNETKNRSEIQVKLEKIEGAIEKADSYSIAKDEKSTFNSLKEAKILLSTIADSKIYKEKIDALNKSLQDRLNKIAKIVDIDPTLIASIGPLDLNFNPQKLIGYKNQDLELEFYLIDPLSSLLYRYNINHKRGTFILGRKERFAFAASFENKIAFASPNTVFLYNPGDNSFETINLKQPPAIKDFASFGNNLYFLTPAGEILKTTPRDNNGSNPELINWLSKNTAEISNVKDFAVDGNVFVLSSDGIAKYSSGKLKKILAVNVLPTIDEATKIYTGQNFKYLYLLDPRNKRIVILDKNGVIFKQYQSEKFIGLTDLWITGDESKIYLLGGFNLYEIPVILAQQ